MFTGLIETIGTVARLHKGAVSGELQIEAKKILKTTQIGDSIAVNGVCLTVTGIQGELFTADVMAETMRRSTLGTLMAGAHVNLERAMPADGRFGGHIVSGHIDGTGTITGILREENAVWYKICAQETLLKYMVEKGSVAVDGTSLTIAEVREDGFRVSIIPHTLGQTILQYKKQGDKVNLECDVIGKYVERMLSYGAYSEKNNAAEKTSGITMEFLAENGF